MAASEGLRLTAYRCPSGILTIGYGHTKGVVEGMTITKEQAKRLLLADIELARQAVDRHTTVSLAPSQHDALASFTFNVGEGAFKRSSVLRHINNGQLNEAAKVLLTYVHDGYGRVCGGLVDRRLKETVMLLRS